MRPADAGGSFADEAFAVTVDAYAQTPESWERAVHAAIARLFGFLAEHADRTTACIAADCADGADVPVRRDYLVERFAALLEPGFETGEVAPPPVVAEAIGGGIFELVRRHVLERRLEELPAAIPDATVVALSPFIGADDATGLAYAMNVQSMR